MSLVNIRSAIKTILDSIKAANNVTTVYDYPVTNVAETPTIVLLDTEGEEDYANTAQNQSTLHWTVRIIVEKRETQAQDSTQVSTLLAITDAVMVELRKKTNHSLGCTAHSFIIEEITPTEASMQGDVPVFFKEIRLITQSFKTIV